MTEKPEERNTVQNTQEERLKLRKGGRWLMQVGSSHIMESQSQIGLGLKNWEWYIRLKTERLITGLFLQGLTNYSLPAVFVYQWTKNSFYIFKIVFKKKNKRLCDRHCMWPTKPKYYYGPFTDTFTDPWFREQWTDVRAHPSPQEARLPKVKHASLHEKI